MENANYEQETHWLKQFEALVKENISNQNMNNAWLAIQMAVSVRTLYRTIEKLTGTSPSLYIREIKMQKAKEMLESGQYAKVNEVVQAVGYQKAEYFTQLFKQTFGITPNTILKRLK